MAETARIILLPTLEWISISHDKNSQRKKKRVFSNWRERKQKPESMSTFLVSKIKVPSQNISKKLGRANVTGYCIRLGALKDMNIDTLEQEFENKLTDWNGTASR